MEVSPSFGSGIWKPSTRRKVFPSSRPRVIPKGNCEKVVYRLPPKSFNRYIRGPICVRLNESKLLARLKDVGGFNPRYVAVNRREAKRFVNLLGDVESLKVKRPVMWDKNSSNNNHSNFWSVIHRQDNTMHERDEKSSERRTVNRLPTIPGTTAIQQCFDAGSLLEGGAFRRLCTECSAITQLPAGVFPRFINEVACGENAVLCSPAIGACQQRVLRFNFLRFTGNFERDDQLSALFGVDVFVEETEIFVQDIRACCECRMFS